MAPGTGCEEVLDRLRCALFPVAIYLHAFRCCLLALMRCARMAVCQEKVGTPLWGGFSVCLGRVGAPCIAPFLAGPTWRCISHWSSVFFSRAACDRYSRSTLSLCGCSSILTLLHIGRPAPWHSLPNTSDASHSMTTSHSLKAPGEVGTLSMPSQGHNCSASIQMTQDKQ